MHVGFVVYGDLDRTSGGYRYDRELVAGLERRGDEVDVISLPPPERNGSPDRGSSSDGPDPPVRDRLDRPYDVLLQDELCRPTLRRHNEALTRPESLVAIVHDLRSPDPGTGNPSRVREREREYLRSLDGAVCTSRFTRDRTTEVVDLPTRVAPPAGRHEGPAIDPEAVAERARSEPLRLAFVGNLLPRKGVETLLESLARVDRDWMLTVVGSHDADPAYATTVRDRVVSLGLADRVTFTGRIADEELDAVYRDSHVLTMPSRYEAFGMVALEAMEYGVVPIATRVGGPTEFVERDRNGVLADPDDPERIAAAVRDLAADRDRLARLGRGALETAADHPTWEETTDQVRSFLGDVLANESGTSTPSPGGDVP